MSYEVWFGQNGKWFGYHSFKYKMDAQRYEERYQTVFPNLNVEIRRESTCKLVDGVTKVTPIDRVINDCKRRADDAWWDGNDEEARLHEQEQKLYEQDKEEGILWVPNF